MKYLLIEALHPQIDDVTEKILDVYRRLKEQREPINIIVVDYQPELTKLAQDYRIDLDDIWQLADIVQRTKGYRHEPRWFWNLPRAPKTELYSDFTWGEIKAGSLRLAWFDYFEHISTAWRFVRQVKYYNRREEPRMIAEYDYRGFVSRQKMVRNEAVYQADYFDETGLEALTVLYNQDQQPYLWLRRDGMRNTTAYPSQLALQTAVLTETLQIDDRPEMYTVGESQLIDDLMASASLTLTARIGVTDTTWQWVPERGVQPAHDGLVVTIMTHSDSDERLKAAVSAAKTAGATQIHLLRMFNPTDYQTALVADDMIDDHVVEWTLWSEKEVLAYELADTDLLLTVSDSNPVGGIYAYAMAVKLPVVNISNDAQSRPYLDGMTGQRVPIKRLSHAVDVVLQQANLAD